MMSSGAAHPTSRSAHAPVLRARSARAWAASRPVQSRRWRSVENRRRRDRSRRSVTLTCGKSAKRLQPIHFAVVRSYLCAADRLHGLLLNFAGKTLEASRVFSRGRP